VKASLDLDSAKRDATSSIAENICILYPIEMLSLVFAMKGLYEILSISTTSPSMCYFISVHNSVAFSPQAIYTD
jgi:hypothetical protein